jgi:GntR family transcriptional regulator
MSARPILVRIDPGDGLPIYRQIVEQVKAAIAAGALAEGDRLPSHRELAKDVVVAPLTVARAYDLLEREGFLVRERGRGAFVAAAAKHAAAPAAKQLNGRASALVRHAQALGLTREEALRALREAWEEGKEK